MMQDYERVTELQEIAAQSSGATMAQMATYMEGMEASLNKIRVAWEEIISNIVDNKGIIDLIDYIGNFLDTIGNFLSTDFGLTTTLTLVLTLTAGAVANKIKEYSYAKLIQNIEEKKRILAIKNRQEAIKLLKVEKQKTLENQKQAIAKSNLTEEEKTAKIKLLELQYTREIQELDQEQIENEMTLSTLGHSQAESAWNTASAITTIGGGLLSVITGSKT